MNFRNKFQTDRIVCKLEPHAIGPQHNIGPCTHLFPEDQLRLHYAQSSPAPPPDVLGDSAHLPPEKLLAPTLKA